MRRQEEEDPTAKHLSTAGKIASSISKIHTVPLGRKQPILATVNHRLIVKKYRNNYLHYYFGFKEQE